MGFSVEILGKINHSSVQLTNSVQVGQSLANPQSFMLFGFNEIAVMLPGNWPVTYYNVCDPVYALLRSSWYAFSITEEEFPHWYLLSNIYTSAECIAQSGAH